MLQISVFLLALAFTLPAIPAYAESCDTDCHRQCRIRTDLPPLEFIEPVCHSKCEVAKKAACIAGQDLPTIPLTPKEQIEVYGDQACAIPFNAVTGAAVARCSNWDGRTEDQHLIAQAADHLIAIGVMGQGELSGVQVRWCPLLGAHGMAPDRNRVYLDISLKGNMFETASTLAHEVYHLRQYRRAGSDRFKCEYSRQFAECGGCQDLRNSFEREAYEFEDQVRPAIRRSIQDGHSVSVLPSQSPPQTRVPVRFCQTPLFTCNIPPVFFPMGTPCFCINPYGQHIPGQAF